MNPPPVSICLMLSLTAVWQTSCQSASTQDSIISASAGSTRSSSRGGENSLGGGTNSGGTRSSAGGSRSDTIKTNNSEASRPSTDTGQGGAGESTPSHSEGGRTSDQSSILAVGGAFEPQRGGSVGAAGKSTIVVAGGRTSTVGPVGRGGAAQSGGQSATVQSATVQSEGGAIAVGGTSATASATPTDCAITIKTKSLSTAIPTVGIVEWSTDLAGLTEANVEFGLDTKYGMTAPVDLKEPNYRTLVLGMKAGGKTYHFRVVAKAGDKTCSSQDNTLPATGEPPTTLPQLTFTPPNATGLDGGFLVMESFKQAFGTSGDGAAYIIDGDGDFVWWYVVKGVVDLSRARQSYDSKYMWITSVNAVSNTQKMVRVKMDGSDAQDLTKEFGNTNHDFAVRSDETLAFITYGSNNCDDIKERSPSGSVTTIINSGTAVGASACHCNAIHYDRNDDTIVFSELDTSSIIKVTRDTKKVVWVMSAQNSSKATVTGITWKNQHGMHIIDKDHLLFFNNNTGPNSTAIEAELSIASGKGTAKQLWSYPSTVTVQYMGDVQRLSNGNTLVTYSSAGEIREVSSSGSVLQTIKISGSGNLVGFTEKRKSLYGPPPR